MRRTIVIASIIFATVVTGAAGFASTPARAADNEDQSSSQQAPISDQQADQVRQNCKQAQSVLQRLQTTDVATRVNRGRIYEGLLNRLIAPFNSRVNFNRYDASTLVSDAAALNQKFTAFKNDYVTYSDSFSHLLSINCEADPRGFYDLLVTTRDDRTRVAADITDMSTLTDRYTEAFGQLRSSIEGHQ